MVLFLRFQCNLVNFMEVIMADGSNRFVLSSSESQVVLGGYVERNFTSRWDGLSDWLDVLEVEVSGKVLFQTPLPGLARRWFYRFPNKGDGNCKYRITVKVGRFQRSCEGYGQDCFLAYLQDPAALVGTGRYHYLGTVLFCLEPKIPGKTAGALIGNEMVGVPTGQYTERIQVTVEKLST
jgi:hypothetical protein